MHLHSYMPYTFIIGYKRQIYGWPHSVPFTLFLSMNVGLIICLTLSTTISGETIPYKIPYNYYDIWMVVGQNSSGQLFFDTDLYSRRIFIWKPYNASIAPSLFFEEYPKILQGDISTTPSGNLEGTVLEDIRVTSQPALEKAEEKVSSKHRSGIHPTNAPATTDRNQMCETVYLISETFLLQNQMMTTNPEIRMTLTLRPCSHLGAVNLFLN